MVSSWSSTTWTMGRMLDRLLESGEPVVVYAGEHAFTGIIRGIGDHLLTMQTGDEVVVVSLPQIRGVKLLRGTVGTGHTPPAEAAG